MSGARAPLLHVLALMGRLLWRMNIWLSITGSSGDARVAGRQARACVVVAASCF